MTRTSSGFWRVHKWTFGGGYSQLVFKKKRLTCLALIGLENFTLDWRVELIVNKSILFQYDKLITFSYEGFWGCRQGACHIHREAQIPNPSRRIAIPASKLKESTTSTFQSLLSMWGLHPASLYNYYRVYYCASCTKVFACIPHLPIPISPSSVTLRNTQASTRDISSLLCKYCLTLLYVHVCSIGKTVNLNAPMLRSWEVHVIDHASAYCNRHHYAPLHRCPSHFQLYNGKPDIGHIVLSTTNTLGLGTVHIEIGMSPTMLE